MLVSGCQSTNPRSLDEQPVKASPKMVRLGDPHSSQKALVIGNRDYAHSPLRNTLNDAEDMASRLESMGFDITLATNLNRRAMKNVVKVFGKRLSKTGDDVAFFYFSGHGAQVAGKNFLIPTDNDDLREEKDLEPNAVSAQTILAMMKQANKGMNILILDACRDNPYKGSEKSMTRGLSEITPPRGSLVAFATAPGTTASDGDERNGVFTGTLLDALEGAEHKRIEDVFMEVRDLVLEKTKERQEPWYNASIRKPFCFGGCPR
ncbi:peptidase C14 caspase catalytic subunit p20 [Candidatus Thiomargarita nelsonii]|uniref:Peptidase C14 caspase catalytic subunit p20 n=1 Tax=Candidatus Thiomargarita nelsonii TaxID=1003181 RepID=A0A176S7N6_9GAMM|nr:peptidase C14 caspase catalytic subunit p20 [Candidatus Thiomargarita nelsonii]